MKNNFFAVISRMKYINRWALMRNTIQENLSEHSLETAYIAHVLAVMRNKRHRGNISPERCALLAMYHDCTEIITGDLPTPIKYYNPEIRDAYGEIEENAKNKLLSYLPDDLKDEYEPLFVPTEKEMELWKLVKAADKISALIKCLDERNMGNNDFKKAEASTLEAIKKLDCDEANEFLEEFLPAYGLTLDEQA